MLSTPIKVSLVVLGLFFLYGTVTYAAPFLTAVGGTGTTSPSGILYGDNSTTNHLNTVTIGSNLTFSAGTLSASGGGTGFGTTSADYWITATTTLPSITTMVNLGTVKSSLTGAVQSNAGVLYTTSTSSASCSSGVSCSSFTVVGTVSPSITNTGVTSNVAGAGIAVSGSTGAVTVTNTISYPFIGNATTTLLNFNGNASTTQISATLAYFGGTATTTFLATGFEGIGTSSPYANLSINAPGQNGPFFVIGSSTSELFSIKSSATANILEGTSTAFTASTGSTVTFTAGGTSSTTINLGEIGGTGQTQFNVQTSGGTAACMFVNAAGTLVVSLGVCK